MKHHEFLVTMRRRGLRPASVWLECECTPALTDMVAELNRMPGAHHVALEPADVPERLDLRWLHGCTVYVRGVTEPVIRRVFAAAQDEGAERVIAFGPDFTLDTAGLLTQPKEYARG